VTDKDVVDFAKPDFKASKLHLGSFATID